MQTVLHTSGTENRMFPLIGQKEREEGWWDSFSLWKDIEHDSMLNWDGIHKTFSSLSNYFKPSNHSPFRFPSPVSEYSSKLTIILISSI